MTDEKTVIDEPLPHDILSALGFRREKRPYVEEYDWYSPHLDIMIEGDSVTAKDIFVRIAYAAEMKGAKEAREDVKRQIGAAIEAAREALYGLSEEAQG